MHYFTAHRTALGVRSECDITELTVEGKPGYRVTITGYSAVALFGRTRTGWAVTLSAPGHQTQQRPLGDPKMRKYIAMEDGAAMLASYIVREKVARRSGRVTPTLPVGSPRGERRLDRAQTPKKKGGFGKFLGDVLDEIFD